MTVVYINHGEKSQEEKKRQVPDHPLVANNSGDFIFSASKNFHCFRVMNKKIRVRLSY
jgi:hypothetical protein